MTVSSPVNSVTYTGNNATTVFSYSFEIRVSENAVVILTDITDPDNPIATTLTAAQYTLTGVGEEAGGTVTYPLVGSPITTNQRITIQSIEPFTQEVDLVNQDGFYPEVVEGALDKLTRMCQQLDEQLSRAVLAPIGSTQDVDLSELITAINVAAAALASATGVLTPCTANGVLNTLQLTPVTGTLVSYINQNLFSFVATTTTTTAATVNISGLGAKKLYLSTGVQANADDIVTGRYYLLAYVSDLDAGNGGFYIIGTDLLTLARMPTQAQATILGRGYGASTGVPSALTAAQSRAVIGPQSFLFTGSLSVTVGSNILTIAVKTAAGADPSATDPVFISVRDSTVTGAAWVTLAIVAPLSLAVPDTATLGTINSIPFRLWFVLFNDAGTPRIGVLNTVSGSDVYPLAGWQIASSTTIGTGSDSAHVFYSDAGVTSKAYTILGFSTWETGLGTAGTWSAAPTRTQLFAPGVPTPGQVIQVARLTVTTASGSLSAAGDLPGYTKNITLRSAPHFVRIKTNLSVSADGGGNGAAFQLVRTATVIGGGTAAGNRPSSIGGVARIADGLSIQSQVNETIDKPGVTTAITYKITYTVQTAVFVNMSNTDTDVAYAPRTSSSMTLEEIMV